jgi:cell division protein ZipA
MESQSLTPTELRIILAVVGAIVLALIYAFGRPRTPGQGKRTFAPRDSVDRVEPTFGDDVPDPDAPPAQGEFDMGLREELNRLGDAIAERRDVREPEPPAEPRVPARSKVGARPDLPVERIVTLYVAARPGHLMAGSDLIVALEKCGLQFGDMGIFHRPVDGKSDSGPVFSVANMVKPGHFDMSQIPGINTPGVSFFMALPGPLPALDAWDTMLPTAQRLAELLDANVLDEERNALGRQRVAHIRDELRAWDRKQESHRIKPGW